VAGRVSIFVFIFDEHKNRWKYFVFPNFFSAAKVIFDEHKNRWKYFVFPNFFGAL